jgi:hypothetical protein
MPVIIMWYVVFGFATLTFFYWRSEVVDPGDPDNLSFSIVSGIVWPIAWAVTVTALVLAAAKELADRNRED